MTWEERRAENLLLWNELAERHEGSDFYDLAGMRSGAEVMRRHELQELGPVAGRSLCHLQCHIGTDTLAWARHGARVTGLDFSTAAVEVARRLAADLGIEADFVVGDVYEAPAALAGRTFDIVYTGYGALVWLPDLDRWAGVVARLLKPGGVLYLSEFHPLHETMAADSLDIVEDYFRESASTADVDGDYAGTGDLTHRRSHEWIHPLGEVVSAVAAAGLRIEFLHEREGIAWPRWPFLVRGRDGLWTTPEGMPRLPLQYTLLARKASYGPSVRTRSLPARF